MSSHNKTIVNTQPVVDEWGIYDPSRAGLAAVLERLEAKGSAIPVRNDLHNMAVSMRQVEEMHPRR
jgi:hypothetical protein